MVLLLLLLLMLLMLLLLLLLMLLLLLVIVIQEEGGGCHLRLGVVGAHTKHMRRKGSGWWFHGCRRARGRDGIRILGVGREEAGIGHRLVQWGHVRGHDLSGMSDLLQRQRSNSGSRGGRRRPGLRRRTASPRRTAILAC